MGKTLFDEIGEKAKRIREDDFGKSSKRGAQHIGRLLKGKSKKRRRKRRER